LLRNTVLDDPEEVNSLKTKRRELWLLEESILNRERDVQEREERVTAQEKAFKAKKETLSRNWDSVKHEAAILDRCRHLMEFGDEMTSDGDKVLGTIQKRSGC
jgi:uncharacterized protein (DUF3084 family)